MTPEQSSKLIQVLENISNTLADIHADMISIHEFKTEMGHTRLAILGER